MGIETIFLIDTESVKKAVYATHVVDFLDAGSFSDVVGLKKGT